MAGAEDMAEGITSVNYKAIMEVLKIIGRRNAIFIRN